MVAVESNKKRARWAVVCISSLCSAPALEHLIYKVESNEAIGIASLSRLFKAQLFLNIFLRDVLG